MLGQKGNIEITSNEVDSVTIMEWWEREWNRRWAETHKSARFKDLIGTIEGRRG